MKHQIIEVAVTTPTVGGFDYSYVPSENTSALRASAERIRGGLKKSVSEMFWIGKELLSAKELLAHGQFMKWVGAEFGMAASSANRFMRVAENLGPKFVTVTNLPPSVVYELAAPSTPDNVREVLLERAAKGEVFDVKAVRSMRLAAANSTSGTPDSNDRKK